MLAVGQRYARGRSESDKHSTREYAGNGETQKELTEAHKRRNMWFNSMIRESLTRTKRETAGAETPLSLRTSSEVLCMVVVSSCREVSA